MPDRTIAPILILGFNRPDRIKNLIESIRKFEPPTIFLALDGPRKNNENDFVKNAECRKLVSSIDWTNEVQTLFRDENLGLQNAVPQAVTWVLSQQQEVIVLEDDVVVTGEFLSFASDRLTKYKNRSEIMHISGYNVVPREHLSLSSSSERLSKVPESIAWATWDRAWKLYDPSLNWSRNAAIKDIERHTFGKLSALRWKQMLGDASSGRISTWAYRWVESIWANDGLCLSPNVNLVTYNGYADGTNTLRRARWPELPIGELTTSCGEPTFDLKADQWIHKVVFRGDIAGVLTGPFESLALEIRNRYRKREKSK